MFLGYWPRKRPLGNVSCQPPTQSDTVRGLDGDGFTTDNAPPTDIRAPTSPRRNTPLTILTVTQQMEAILPKNYGHLSVEIPGARTMLDAVIAASSPWAIVTSGTVPLVTGWLKARSLPRPSPDCLVTAEDVEHGKPDPSCYLLGRKRIGLTGDDAHVLVLEDSPAGIRAGKDAGCKVLGLVTSHTVEQVVAAGPDWVVRDLESVRVVRSEGGSVTIELSNALRL
jgi:glycerol 3-phosphatase-1